MEKIQDKKRQIEGFDKTVILEDYYTCCLSREMSIQLRKEVLNGRAKFGTGGAGKEVPQVAMARAFRKGDYMSSYYREQTFILAKNLANPEDYFAILYGDTEHDPFSGGRQMTGGYSTPFIDENGAFIDQRDTYNLASVISCVAGQMPRALGLALATKMYRENDLIKERFFSKDSTEISFCTIGDASTSEGVFFETINAAGVMQVPLAIFVWDDGYGISVPTDYQTTKGSISAVLEGFRATENQEGLDIYTLKAWDYPKMVEIIEKGITKMRSTYRPALFHIQECTQPLGHSTSGSHERYKSKERLDWEKEMDCILKMEQWIVENGYANLIELDSIKQKAQQHARTGRDKAWVAFQAPIQHERKALNTIYQNLSLYYRANPEVMKIADDLSNLLNPVRSTLLENARRMQALLLGETKESVNHLTDWIETTKQTLATRYHSHLYSDSSRSALKIPVVPVEYESEAPYINGSEILNAYFDKALGEYPELYAFGEDVGKIGDVNQAFAGMQKKYGEARVFDTGIREWTIAGQAIGMAMRGLKPIAEMQYLDYLSYAFSALTDDLATLRYRTAGTQMAPAIIRTRGHRLEGIWHSGSPMGMLLHSMRGIYILVPRNMTQAAGMYATMLQSDDPAILIECLNGYRLKERLPSNLGSFTVPLGVPEVLQEGTDVTLVTYGSCIRVAQAGIQLLAQKGISVELIDVQTLLPFDLEHWIVQSLKKTNRIVFMDEDVPGGATAFMLQEVIEKQEGYQYLDSPPTTLTAAAHRPAFGDDGNYVSKPNESDVFRTVYKLMAEAEPERFPL